MEIEVFQCTVGVGNGGILQLEWGGVVDGDGFVLSFHRVNVGDGYVLFDVVTHSLILLHLLNALPFKSLYGRTVFCA